MVNSFVSIVAYACGPHDGNSLKVSISDVFVWLMNQARCREGPRGTWIGGMVSNADADAFEMDVLSIKDAVSRSCLPQPR